MRFRVDVIGLYTGPARSLPLRLLLPVRQHLRFGLGGDRNAVSSQPVARNGTIGGEFSCANRVTRWMSNMHWRYLTYLARHKWFVFLAGRRTGAPVWRLLIHDWSKFLPVEWTPYAIRFSWVCRLDQSQPVEMSRRRDAFDRAWLHHQHWNKHHWQHFLLKEDAGGIRALPMPDSLTREMVADWMGAGRAITGKWDVLSWYQANRERILLHPATRDLAERILREVGTGAR